MILDRKELAASTLEEHRLCMEVVRELEACLDSTPDREGVWLERVRAKLPELIRALREHFAVEEHGPLFRDLPLRHPQLAERLARLEAEHPTILGRVREVEQRADRLHEPEMHQLRELDSHLQLLVAIVRRHEAEENEIVLGAAWDELGGGD